MAEDQEPTSPGADAVFIGWQPSGFGEPIAIYNVTAEGHPANGSTVTARTLRKMSLRIPEDTPPVGQPKPL